MAEDLGAEVVTKDVHDGAVLIRQLVEEAGSAGITRDELQKRFYERISRCRYTDLDNRPCTGEALDPEAPIRLCERHAALVLEWLGGAMGLAVGVEEIE